MYNLGIRHVFLNIYIYGRGPQHTLALLLQLSVSSEHSTPVFKCGVLTLDLDMLSDHFGFGIVTSAVAVNYFVF